MSEEVQINPAKRIFKRTLLHFFFCLGLLSLFAFLYSEDMPALGILIWAIAFILFVCGLLASKAQKEADFLSYEACLALYRASSSRSALTLFFLLLIVLMAAMLGCFFSPTALSMPETNDIFTSLYAIMGIIAAASLIFIVLVYLVINALVGKSLTASDRLKAQPEQKPSKHVFIFCAWLMNTNTHKAFWSLILAFITLLLSTFSFEGEALYLFWNATILLAALYTLIGTFELF